VKLRKQSNKELDMSRKLVALLTVAVAGLFMGSVASAQITGTAHDLSAYDFDTGTAGTQATGQICVTCHVPHENSDMASSGLLWNHGYRTASVYSVYSSTTLDGTATAPGATSLLCLGCHDGTIAVDSYGGATGSFFIDGSGGAFGDVAAFGADLSNDHPIGLTYSPGTGTDQDPELYSTTTDTVAWGDGTARTVGDMLQSGKVECASCHDVHATTSGGTGGNTKLLNITNDGSAICLACHNK
jgi:hypothetical protein